MHPSTAFDGFVDNSFKRISIFLVLHLLRLLLSDSQKDLHVDIVSKYIKPKNGALKFKMITYQVGKCTVHKWRAAEAHPRSP